MALRLPSIGIDEQEHQMLSAFQSRLAQEEITSPWQVATGRFSSPVQALTDLFDFGKTLAEPLTNDEYVLRKEIFERKYTRLSQQLGHAETAVLDSHGIIENSCSLFLQSTLAQLRQMVDQLPRRLEVTKANELQVGDILSSQPSVTIFLKQEGSHAKCLHYEEGQAKECSITIDFPVTVERRMIQSPGSTLVGTEETLQPGSLIKQGDRWGLITSKSADTISLIVGGGDLDDRVYLEALKPDDFLEGSKLSIGIPQSEALGPVIGNLNELLSAKSKLHDLKAGSIFSAHDHRFLVIDNVESNERVALCVHAGQSIVMPPEAFVNSDIMLNGSVLEQRFLDSQSNRFAETVKTWEAVEQGGYINYLDGESRIVARDELLSVDTAYSSDYKELPASIWRNVRALRTDMRSGDVSLVCRNWEVTELSLAPVWLPEAMRMEVFGAVGDQRVEHPLVSNNRVIASAFASFREAAKRFDGELREFAVERGLQDTLQRVWSLQNDKDQDSLMYLRGLDPEFEELLAAHVSLAQQHKRFDSLSRAWSGLVVQRAPEVALQLTRFDDLLEKKAEEFQQGFAERLESIFRDLQDSELKGVTQEFLRVTKYLTKRFELSREALSNSSQYSLKLYDKDSVPEEVVRQSAAIMKSHEAPTGMAHAFLHERGGITTKAFSSVAGIKNYLSKGSKLLVISRNDEGREVVTHVAGFTGPQQISPEKKDLMPVLHDGGAAVYDIACMAKNHTDFIAGPVALLRAATIAMVHDGAESIYWEIDADNSASTQIGFAENHYVVIENAYARTLPGEREERKFNIWGVLTDPEQRTLLALSPQSSKERRSIIQRMQQAQGGFLLPTPSEIDQMRTVHEANRESSFTRWSIGVASMQESAQNRLLELIKDGVFKNLSGVHTWTPTYNVELFEGVYRIVEGDGGAHKFFTQLRGELSEEAFPVGFLLKDVTDQNYGRAVEVLLPHGEKVSMPIISTSTGSEQSLAVGDLTQFRSIQGTFRKPPKVEPENQGVNKWAATAARSAYFGDMFNDQLYVFASGGRVVGWEIGHTMYNIIEHQRSDKQILLLSNLGGSVDKIIEDPVRALQSFYPQITRLPNWENQVLAL
ncbi:MAG: hypothetical protein KDD62_05425, partial [Bdellovibrionales bacterium]|nr:hypothetical protein [Bdellovibrionales bacterium]